MVGEIVLELTERHQMLSLIAAVHHVGEICERIVMLDVSSDCGAEIAGGGQIFGVYLPSFPRRYQFACEIISGNRTGEVVERRCSRRTSLSDDWIADLMPGVRAATRSGFPRRVGDGHDRAQSEHCRDRPSHRDIEAVKQERHEHDVDDVHPGHIQNPDTKQVHYGSIKSNCASICVWNS